MRNKVKAENEIDKITFDKLTLHKLDWLEFTAIGIGIWFLFYPKPYTLLFTVLLCIPILGVILNGIKGRPSIASLVAICTEDNEKTKYDVADFIDFPALILLVRVIIDFEFESFYSLLIPGIIGFAIMLILLFSTHKIIIKTTKNKTWIYLSIICNIFLYNYVGTYGANCVYDISEPKVYKTEVIDKRISKGRKGFKTYYVKVKPWGHHYDYEEISVSSDKYKEINIGERINIDLKKGLFNIPWFYIK